MARFTNRLWPGAGVRNIRLMKYPWPGPGVQDFTDGGPPFALPTSICLSRGEKKLAYPQSMLWPPCLWTHGHPQPAPSMALVADTPMAGGRSGNSVVERRGRAVLTYNGPWRCSLHGPSAEDMLELCVWSASSSPEVSGPRVLHHGQGSRHHLVEVGDEAVNPPTGIKDPVQLTKLSSEGMAELRKLTARWG